MPWTWSHADTDGDNARELTQATDRKVAWRRRAPADLSFKIDGRHDEALTIRELVTEITARRNGRPIFRGRVGPTEDDVNETSHAATITAGDYGAVLKRRNVYDTDPLGPFSSDAGDLAYDIVNYTQGRTAGDLGITAGLGIPAGINVPTGTLLTAGKSIADTLDLLSNTGVFDWQINADLELDIYPGGRLRITNEILDYGGAVSRFKRTVDPSTYANSGRYTGDDTTTPQLLAVADLATRGDGGRWERIYGDRDIHDDTTLAATGNADLARASLVIPGYLVTFRPDFWQGPSHIWPGDIVKFVAKSGRVQVKAEPFIVEELTATLNGDGDETITAALGRNFPSYLARTAVLAGRIRDLERT